MSKLQDNEVLACSCCFTVMMEPMFCRKKTICPEHFSGKDQCIRCPYVICKYCKFCYGCDKEIQQLKEKLKQYRYGRCDGWNKKECDKLAKQLKDSYDLDYNDLH